MAICGVAGFYQIIIISSWIQAV